MHEIREDIGVVLKKQRYRDRDVILTAFTEKHGVIALFAPNAIQSKRFTNAIETMAVSRFRFDSKKKFLQELGDDALHRLEAADSVYELGALTSDPEKLGYASLLSELVVRTLPRERPMEEVYRVFGQSLKLLDESPIEECAMIATSFLFRLLQSLGVQPSLTRCGTCSTPLNTDIGQSIYLLPAAGHWICGPCFSEREKTADRSAKEISSDTLITWLPSVLLPIRQTPRGIASEDARALLAALLVHAQFHINGLQNQELSSLRYLREIGQPIL